MGLWYEGRVYIESHPAFLAERHRQKLDDIAQIFGIEYVLLRDLFDPLYNDIIKRNIGVEADRTKDGELSGSIIPAYIIGGICFSKSPDAALL